VPFRPDLIIRRPYASSKHSEHSVSSGIGAAHSGAPVAIYVLHTSSQPEWKSDTTETQERYKKKITMNLSKYLLLRTPSECNPRVNSYLQVAHYLSPFHSTQALKRKFDTGSNEPGQIYAAQLIKLAASPSFCFWFAPVSNGISS